MKRRVTKKSRGQNGPDPLLLRLLSLGAALVAQDARAARVVADALAEIERLRERLAAAEARATARRRKP